MCPDSGPERLGLREPQTLDAFLTGIGPRAFRFAEAGLRHREDALDAVQEAMLRMLGYRDRPATEWTPLFWSILRSRIVDAQRRRTFRLGWLDHRDPQSRGPGSLRGVLPDRTGTEHDDVVVPFGWHGEGPFGSCELRDEPLGQ